MAEETKIDPESLKRFIPLNTLSDEGMALLLPHVEVFTAQKGTLLFQRGDEKKLHFYLLSGRVQLQEEEGDDDLLQAGSVQAKFPIGHRFPRKVSARAAERIQILRIDSRKLELAQSPESASDSGLNDSGLADSILVDEPDEADDDWMSQLLRSRVFQLIPPGNIQRVMMCMEEHQVKKGDVVIHQGEEGDYFYLINRGHCRVDRDMGDGNPPVELARLGPGASFGEDALLAGNKRSANVTMLDDGRLLRLSKKNFVELIKEPVTKPFGFNQAKAKVDEGGARWLDVREAAAFAKGHLQGAINIPFNQLRFQIDKLDLDSHYVVCCQDGRTSHAAAYLLASKGIQATVLDKGLQMVPGGEFGQADEGKAEEDIGAAPGCDDRDKLQVLVDKLRQQLSKMQQEMNDQEEKRLAEISSLHDALEQARKDHSGVLTELLELKKSAGAGPGQAGELARAREEIAQLKQALKQARSECSEGDEALREQVKGYLEEKLLLEQEVDELRKALKQGTKPAAGNRELEEEADRLRKELAQAELALDAEVSARLELEEELSQLKNT
ncbi:cyclic nucleotide-binding domain-containing protein [Magnetovirga frankeli]|uniref:cyclic nucleotide-binding domain-containing protein n=1 Tax=Magnetovirga frankeli TaxID=947516 RepID=UPI001293C00D|nr:cyclic nucleotide-binding domain-containing protein [gamma proteobacterium SS-5]